MQSAGETLNPEEMSPTELRKHTASFLPSYPRFVGAALAHRIVAERQFEIATQNNYSDANDWKRTIEAFSQCIEFAGDVVIAVEFGLQPPAAPNSRAA